MAAPGSDRRAATVVVVSDPRRGAVLVVGAGIAGLLAAARLSAAGLGVLVVDKGRGVGGRLATRRIGPARLDHGAQFFTVRSDEFAAISGEWLTAGVAREWCRGFRQPPDGHPRYVGVAGMTDVAKAVAGALDVRTSTRLVSIDRGVGDSWAATVDGGAPLTDEGGTRLEFDAVICTPPVPQTLDLLVGTALDPAALAALAVIRYEPTLAALAVLDGPGAVPAPGGVQLDDGPLSWVGDNLAKGISSVPALTLHASGDESARRWDEPTDRVLGAMLRAGLPWTGGAAPLGVQLARWRYAAPSVLHDQRCVVAVEGRRPLVCAGDAFGEPRVEGAALSGLAAGAAVLARLG